MSKSLIFCENPLCNKKFWRDNREINRSKKLSRKQYCCLSCYGIDEGSKILKNIDPEIVKKNAKNIKKYCHNRKDIYTPFRYFMKCMKNKNRKNKWNEEIDVKYLKEMWDYQKGICPHTGLKMELPLSSHGFEGGRIKFNGASIDRIDSSKGYIKGNIEIVCCAFNYAKNTFSNDDMIIFFKAIAKKWA